MSLKDEYPGQSAVEIFHGLNIGKPCPLCFDGLVRYVYRTALTWKCTRSAHTVNNIVNTLWGNGEEEKEPVINEFGVETP